MLQEFTADERLVPSTTQLDEDCAVAAIKAAGLVPDTEVR